MVIFVFFVFCNKAVSENEGKRKGRDYPVEYDPAVISDEGQKEVDDYLDELETRFAKLRGGLTAEAIDGISEYFGHRGTLTGYDRQIYTGKAGVACYLKSIPEEAKGFEFRIRYVYVKEFPQSGNKEALWHVVGVIFSHSFTINDKKVDPVGGLWGGHVEGCTWGH